MAKRNIISVAFTVGLDFGTSTVKCIVCARLGERGEKEIRFMVPICKEPLFPSLVWEHDGELHFGSCKTRNARLYRSIKSCLRCGVLKEATCNNCFERCALSAELISWALLSFVVSRILDELRNRYPKRDYEWKQIDWNMGVPLNGLEQKSLQQLFCRLLWCATQAESYLPATPCRGRVRELSEKYELLHRRTPQVVEQTGIIYADNCFVISEAHVAINAFLHTGGNIDDGLYFVCDVGAGTTDIAFFRFARDRERQIVFYGGSSTRAAGDSFLEALIGEHCRQNPTLVPIQVLAKVQTQLMSDYSTKDKPRKMRPIPPAYFQSVLQRITDGRDNAFKLAYPKEERIAAWEAGLRGGAVFGGGSFIAGVETACLKPIYYAGNRFHALQPDHVPLRRNLSGGATELHRTAWGLSIPVLEFYAAWLDVKPFKPPPPPMRAESIFGTKYDR